MTNRIVTFEMTVTKDHYPHVIDPRNVPLHEQPRYSIRVPASLFPECLTQERIDGLGPMVNASAPFRPTVVPANGLHFHWNQWEALIQEARRWNYNPDHLLVGRGIVVHARTWQQDNEHGRYIRVSLLAVQVLGDLEEDEGLKLHVQKTMEGFKL